MELIVQVLPPSVEMKIGALGLPAGSGVKAEAAMCSGLEGLTSRFGSLSLLVSKLICFGMIFTISIVGSGAETGMLPAAFLALFLLAVLFLFELEVATLFVDFFAGMVFLSSF